MNSTLDDATFVKLLKRNAERYGDGKAALRVKNRGIWQETTWKQYYENVKHFSLGLGVIGTAPGETVAIIGANRPATLYAVLASQAAGAVPVCLYQDSTAAEIADLLQRFRVRLVVAEDQEQVDKILDIRGRFPDLKAIVYCDSRGMRRYSDPGLISLEQLSLSGQERDTREPGAFEQNIAEGSADAIALICTTSGSTAHPRGALLTCRNMLSMAARLDQVAPKRDDDEVVSVLPLAWFGEQMISLAGALLTGFAVNFPEQPETVMTDLREIGPTLFFSSPAVWEGIAASVQIRIMDTTPFKRFMYNTFMAVGRKAAEARLAGKPVGALDSVLFAIAHICLFRALRDRIGLSRIRTALTGGSSLGADVFLFFHSIGVNLKQVYGLTELSGLACMHRDGDVQGTSVGPPLPGTEVSIDAGGQILLKNDGIFKGYFGDDDTGGAVVQDGWLHTGDAGYLTDKGHLVLIERLQDVITLSDGSAFAPQFGEGKITFSPFIRNAVIIGQGKPWLGALVCISGSVVGKWAGDNKISYTTYSDLASRPEVYDLVEKELQKTNTELPEAARIRCFTILFKDLDADDGELTRNGKIRRDKVRELYAPLIEAMYQGAEKLPVDTVIDLQDGKSARIQTTVYFRNMT